MADRVEYFETTCPAGASVSEDFPFAGGEGEVTRIRVFFPRGCAGLVRARIRFAGAQVIPFDTSKALKGNARLFAFDVKGYIVSNAWSMGVANDGKRSHTIRTWFEVDETPTLEAGSNTGTFVLLPLAE